MSASKHYLEFNGHWEVIDSRVCFVVDQPAYAILELQDQLNTPTQGLAVKKPFTLRSNSQNRLYWGAIVRQVMNFHKERGEHWTEAEIHEYNMIKVLGIRPTLVVKGSIVFESFQPTIEFLRLKLKEFQYDPTLLVNVKPKSSKFDTILFTLLIDMCIQHYAEVFGYELKLKLDDKSEIIERDRLRIPKKPNKSFTDLSVSDK